MKVSIYLNRRVFEMQVVDEIRMEINTEQSIGYVVNDVIRKG